MNKQAEKTELQKLQEIKRIIEEKCQDLFKIKTEINKDLKVIDVERMDGFITKGFIYWIEYNLPKSICWHVIDEKAISIYFL